MTFFWESWNMQWVENVVGRQGFSRVDSDRPRQVQSPTARIRGGGPMDNEFPAEPLKANVKD
jgi:hypothetical protein